MTKRYATTSFIYAIIAMVCGVFFREFTRIKGFDGVTRLSVLHTHYFVLGMLFFLVALLLEKNYALSEQKLSKAFFVLYNIGLNITGITFFVIGFMQVQGIEFTKSMNGALSGIAGIGHALLGVSIILFFVSLRRQVKKS